VALLRLRHLPEKILGVDRGDLVQPVALHPGSKVGIPAETGEGDITGHAA